MPTHTIKRFQDMINTQAIIRRLEKHSLALEVVSTKMTKATKRSEIGQLKRDARMLATQIRAAEILLDRTVPRLSSTTLEGGDPDKPLRTEARQIVINPVAPVAPKK